MSRLTVAFAGLTHLGIVSAAAAAEHCDRVIGIPLLGKVGSLNVAVASAICLYASRRARAGGTPR